MESTQKIEPTGSKPSGKPTETRKRDIRQVYEEHSFTEEGVRYAVTNMLVNSSSMYAQHGDRIACEFEKIVLLWGALREQGSWSGVVSTVFLYVHTHYTGSLLGVMKTTLNDFFSVYEEQSEGVSWLRSLKEMHSNWQMATANDGFKHISRLLSTLIGAGLVQASALQCEVSGMKLFTDLCVPKFVSAFDIMDAAMNCVVFFVEGGYECIQSGSITPLLFGEKDFAKFDDTYLDCCKYFDYARPGNYALIETDDTAVFKLIVDTIAEGKRLVQITKNPFSKKMIMDRVSKLQEMECYLTQHRLSANTRVKPFAVVAYGDTGVGKTTLSPLLMHHILKPNGYDASQKSIVNVKCGAPFKEKVRTYHTGCQIDDFGQVHPDFVQESPCEDVREIINPAQACPNMAALELKDKVSYEFKAVVISTNMKDLNAPAYSLEPASVTRRIDCFLTMVVRPEFATNGMLDSSKVEAYYNGEVPIVCDLWTFHMQRSYPIPNPTPGRHATIGWETIVWNGKPMVDVGIDTVLKYIVLESRDHFARQRRMISKTSNIDTQVIACPECKSTVECCVCNVSHVVTTVKAPGKDPKDRTKAPTLTPAQKRSITRENEFEDACRNNSKYDRKNVTDSHLRHNSQYNKSRRKKQDNSKYEKEQKEPDGIVVDNALEEHAGLFGPVVDYVEHLQYLLRFRISYVVPTRLTRSYSVISAASFFVRHPWAKFHAFGMLLVPLFVRDIMDLCILYFVYLYIAYVVFMSYVSAIEAHVRQTRQATWHSASHVAATTAKVLGAGVLMGVLYEIAQKYRSYARIGRTFEEHGFMEPSDDEIVEADQNDHSAVIAKEHNWANVEISPLPCSVFSKTITIPDLRALCHRNTALLLVDGKPSTNLFFIESNVALVATHLAKKLIDRKCTIIRNTLDTVGANFESFVSHAHSAQIPNTDLSLLSIPSGGSWKGLTKYFPEKIFNDGDFGGSLATRQASGEISEYRVNAKPCHRQLSSCVAFGYDYNIDSYVGMCGAPLIAEKKSPMIVGIHVAGVVAQRKGFASAIARSDLEYALEKLERRPSVLLAHSEGVLKPVIYDKPMLDEQALHPKSPVLKLEIDEKTPNLVVYGSCFGRNTYYSRVIPSFISDKVAEVCGVAQKWGKPKFALGRAWIDTLVHSSKPCVGFPPTLLDKAVVDYLKPIFQLLDERPNVKAEIKPLTPMEVVCGKDGKRYINKIDPNTAIGPPLTGTKLQHLTYLDPDDFDDFACPAELRTMFWDEYGEAEEIWLDGRRYHAVFKAFLKDEATPIEKDKVRVVQGAPIVLQIGVRKYFLPIARLLSLFPKITECAVGLNCMGPEWEEFQAHIKRFGTDRIFAGDYSKYDLRLPAQITMAAFKVFITIAKFCGYSERDLKIMHGIATDICYPTVAFNGDLLQFVGINPSGQNLTVYINGLGSSLILRCAYFGLVPEKKQLAFRDACALGTYGDDVKSSVKEGQDEFNHISVAKFLKDHDMGFTMPDKTSTPTPYMNDADADFLKRKNVYIPELGQHVGALADDSIFKSLHANLKSRVLTPEELSADCIDGAMREWFFHGRDVYEMRQAQMEKVAELAGIDHMCHMISVPFDHQVARWRHRYLKEPLPTGVDDNGEVGELYYDPGDFPLEEHSNLPECGSEMLPIAEDMYAPCNGSEGVSLFWWEYPTAMVLVGLPFCFYFTWLIIVGKLRFTFSTWNYSHRMVLIQLLILGGPKWLFLNHIMPTLIMWFCFITQAMIYFDEVGRKDKVKRHRESRKISLRARNTRNK